MDSSAHTRSVTALSASAAGDFVASGSADGAVILWCLESGAWRVAKSTRVHSRALTSLAFSFDGLRLYSASCGGEIAVYDVIGARRRRRKESFASEASLKEWASSATLKSGVYAFPHANGPKEDGMCLYERELEAKRNEKEQANEQVRGQFREKVRSFKMRLEELLKHNEEVVDLERLERVEFTFDLEGQRMLKEANQATIDESVASIMAERAKCNVISRRFREEMWDKMSVKSQKLLAFKSGVEVRNFPVKNDAKEAKRALQVINMRKLELRETRKEALNGWKGRADSLPESAEYVINAASGLPEVNLDSGDKVKKRIKRRSSSIMMPPTTPGGILATMKMRKEEMLEYSLTKI